jgi:small subunit ribosomal protein S13
MVRLLGNNLSNKKKIYIALTCIYGIGIPRSLKILKKVEIDPNVKVSDLTESNISALRDTLETDEFKLEGDLKRLISLNIKRLIDINSQICLFLIRYSCHNFQKMKNVYCHDLKMDTSKLIEILICKSLKVDSPSRHLILAFLGEAHS